MDVIFGIVIIILLWSWRSCQHTKEGRKKAAKRSREASLAYLSLSCLVCELLLTGYCPKTKIIQFSNKFDVLFLRVNNPWVEGVQCLTTAEHPSRGIYGKSEMYRKLEEATGEQHDCLEGWGLPHRAAGPIFYCKVSELKLSCRVMTGICWVSLKGVFHRCRLNCI